MCYSVQTLSGRTPLHQKSSDFFFGAANIRIFPFSAKLFPSCPEDCKSDKGGRLKRVGLFFFMSGAPQRQQLASERTPLTSFAPAPSTLSCVPLTRDLSPADPSPSPWPGVATPLRGNSMPHCCASALLQCTF